jgi:tubulin alpha
MREVVSIHVGQCGIQVGSACWELFCLEHGVRPDGFHIDASEQDEARHCVPFFFETGSNRVVPRALFVDTEATVCDELRKSGYRCVVFANQILRSRRLRSLFHLGCCAQ